MHQPPAPHNPGSISRGPWGSRGSRPAGIGRESERCLRIFLPSPGDQVREGPPTRFLWPRGMDAPETARPGHDRPRGRPGQPGTEPRHPSEGGSGRACHPTAWPRARAACPRSAQPGQRGAGAGAGCGSSPLGSGPLRPRVGSGWAGRAEARLAAERTVATPPPGLGPRRRSPRAQRGGWPSPASGRSALGSPRAAAPSSTRRPGAGRRSAHPVPHTPAASGATPGRRPTPRRPPPSRPAPTHPGTPARLSSACWGVSPLPPPLGAHPYLSALRLALHPGAHPSPGPGTLAGVSNAHARGSSRAPVRTPGGGDGCLPRTCASARGFPSIFPRGQTRPDECPLRPWPALAAAGPALTASVEAAPGAPPLRAARRGGDAGTWEGGRSPRQGAQAPGWSAPARPRVQVSPPRALRSLNPFQAQGGHADTRLEAGERRPPQAHPCAHGRGAGWRWTLRHLIDAEL